MSYVLENEQESNRLEKQATRGAYQVSEELRFLQVKPGQKILDAGCGTGLVARYLSNHSTGVNVEGCDLSQARLDSAKELAGTENEKNIRYFQAQLDAIPAPDNTYDVVTCRYVIEHLERPLEVVKELYRVTQKGGTAYFINFDGLVWNLFPMSSELQEMIKLIQPKLPFDSYAGRKIPDLLQQAGFKEVSWNIDVHTFQGEQLQQELEMNAERITFALPLLAKILGSEIEAHRFKRLFLQEMMKPAATLFYNKFLVSGKK